MDASTIFVVDDDQAVRHSLKLLLEAHRCRVQAFASAAEFLAKVDAGAAGCVVLDYNMPGMNGLDLAGEIKRRGLTLNTILLTALRDADIRERAARVGISIILEKPLTGNELIDAIDAALRSLSPPAPPPT